MRMPIQDYTRYKEGDRVQIREWDDWRTFHGVTESLKKYAGRRCTILGIDPTNIWQGQDCYMIDIDPSRQISWTHSDFVEIEDLNEKVFNVLRGKPNET